MSRPLLPQVDRILSQPLASRPIPIPSKRPAQSDRIIPRPSTSGSFHGRSSSGSSPALNGMKLPSRPLDVLASLHKSTLGLVKTRQGSVLSRGFILKTDYYPSGRASELEIDVGGAPNFRQNKSAMNVFGVAQPRVSGVKALLSLLQCRPGLVNPSKCHWFSTREEPIVYLSGRPYVLRDSASPRDGVTLTDRTENLEAIERRLKADIIAEAAKFSGVILTHYELDNGDIIPSWTAVDAKTVRTQQEVMEDLKAEGWSVEYHRIPITPDRPIENNYLDAFLDVIKGTDPFETPLVFSCGAGIVRTSFAMVGACIIRRRQLVLMGEPDPYAIMKISSGISSPKAVATLEQVGLQQELNKSLLRITYLLQQGLQDHDSRSAIELLMSQPALMESLRKAHQGTYSLILGLLGCLDHGPDAKKLVDRVIDDCDHVVNLREDVLVHRIRYAVSNMDDKTRPEHLAKAAKALEKYFFMIAFASFVEGQTTWDSTFSDWTRMRVEIWNQVKYLRQTSGLKVFAPVSDLSAISKVEAAKKHEVAVGGGQVLGDEWTEHVVKNRSGIVLREGTLLKSDMWHTESARVANGVRGAINFRNVPGTNIYCMGQPTSEAIGLVIERITQAHPDADHLVWITLREEPLVYVNGAPYCLRLEASSLRNIKDYGGISASRLEILEDRLKSDVIAELNTFGQRLLLHSENSEGTVIPVWEEVESVQVAAPKEVMLQHDFPLQYHRIPITSENPPDFTDISDLMDVVLRTGSERGVIVVNCQLGRGRSTLTSILVLLIQRWLHSNSNSDRPRLNRSMSRYSVTDYEPESAVRGPTRQSYQVINNVLRVIRNGLKVKEAVDDAIDQCGDVFNLRDSIETFRMHAEEATDSLQKRQYYQRGLVNLKRYFELIIFQAYLESTPPDTIRTVETFESYVKKRPVFKTFENEMKADGVLSLKRLERMDVAEGIALPDEIAQTVANRSGNILSASTILKSDFFSNLQKMSLPERIEGAANFREIPLLVPLPEEQWAPLSGLTEKVKSMTVVGTGMPQTDGARRVLARLGATHEGGKKVYWTSLREEPVIYVAGRPHVLRLVDRPLQNVEATGITTDVVESMENRLRKDVQREIRSNDGRILLHDEVEDSPGKFTITAQWEKVEMGDVMTPRELFNMMVQDGYQVDYTRVAITDEQAPLPAALGQLVQRVTNALQDGDVIIQNCQMGRGRTTTGMVAASLIATVSAYDLTKGTGSESPEEIGTPGNLSGFLFEGHEGSEEEAYLQGEYKTILQLVGVLSHGKVAKRLTDMAIDQMDGVQNLRRAIFDYKIKVEACEPGSVKQKKLMDIGVNYLYRYGTLIVLANYLIERRQNENQEDDFAVWLKTHREITTLLGRRNLD
ncbi:hypothetical protein FRC01_006011 [Tulasnella sp. 417]|nr:hypothetical protein FRC01_006011 [Tulasnella sp. 417]